MNPDEREHADGSGGQGDQHTLDHPRILTRGALLFFAGVAISAFTIRRGIEPFDEGLTLQAARRVAEGQLPYSDFLWPYGPAQIYLLAGLFKLFGTSLLWWRIERTLVDAAVALVVYLLVLRTGAPRNWALVPWLTAACAMAQPTGANPFAPALLLALLAVAYAAKRPAMRPIGGRAGRSVLAGVLCAVAAAWRLDFGVYATLAAAATVAVGSDSSARAAARAAALVAAVSAAATAVVYLPFVIADGPADTWRALAGTSLKQGSYWRLPFPIHYHGPLASLKDAKHALQFYVPLLLLIGLALVVVALVVRRRRPAPTVAGLAVLGLCSVPYLLSRTDEFHWAPLLVVVAALLAIAIPRTALPLAVPMALVLAALLGYGAANRLSALLRPPALATVHVAVADGVEAPPRAARAIPAMVRAVQRRVAPGEPIYTITRRSDLVRINDPMIYVLTQRDNPTSQDFGLQTGPTAQRAIVAALVRSRPRVIVRWMDPISVVREPNARGRPTGVHILDHWVARHYRLAARYGYYDVLVPRTR